MLRQWRKHVEIMPGSIISVVGISAALFSFESTRLAISHGSSRLSFFFASPDLVVFALLLILFAIYSKKPSFRIHRYPAIGLLLAIVQAASSIFLAESGAAPTAGILEFYAHVARAFIAALLLACWIEVLIPYRARTIATTFALGLFLTGAESMIASAFKPGAINMIIGIPPIASALCLYWFKDHSTSPDVQMKDRPPNARSMQEPDRFLSPPENARHQVALFWTSALLPFACLSFACGSVHFSWLTSQGSAVTTPVIQAAAGLGGVVSGTTLCWLISRFWGRREINSYLLFAIPSLLLALYVALLVSDAYSFLYVILLNIASKIALFMVLMSPFIASRAIAPLGAYVLSFGSYILGRALSGIAQSAIDAPIYSAIVCSAMLLALACILFTLFESQPNSLRLANNSPEAIAPNDVALESDSLSSNEEITSVCSDVANFAYAHDMLSESQTIAADEYSANQVSTPRDTRFRAGLKIDNSSTFNNVERSRSTLVPSNQNDGQTRSAVESNPLGGLSIAIPPPEISQCKRELAACHSVAIQYNLTHREEEVLQLLAEGMNAKAIAETLVVSTATAKSHLRNIYAKLGVHAQSELIILVHKQM